MEFYVGNAKQAAYFYRAAMGFRLVAYRGPETGTRDRVSYVLEQNKIRFVLTTPLLPEGEIAEHIFKHGDGVKSIALSVDDAKSAWEQTTARGAQNAQAPAVDQATSTARLVFPPSSFTAIPFIRLSSGAPTEELFFRAFVPVPGPDRVARDAGLLHIDHVVANVGWGQMNTWVNFYQDVMGFRMFKHFDDQDVSTEYSALMSKVMANGNEKIRFPINEPAEGKRKSQIEEYLDFYGGPGVQHIALATHDIIETVIKLRDQGIEFLQVPTTYYEELTARVGKIDEPVDALQELGILSIATMRATCCRSLRSRWKTDRRCFSKSSSAKAAAVLARGISKRCLRLLNASRRAGEICKSVASCVRQH